MARPSFLDSAWPFTLKIGGRDLHDFGIVTLSAPQLNMSPVDVPFDVLPSRHVAVPSTGAFRPSPFVISGQMAGGSVSELRTNLDAFKQSAISLRGSAFDIVTPLKLETADYTDRYFPVVYTGGFTAQVVGSNPTGQTIANFTLPLLRLTPFAIANSPTNATPTATGPSFEVLEAGTAPCAPLVEIQGASTTPSFYITDCAFYADFNYDLTYIKIDGSTGTGATGAATPIDQFSPGDIGSAMFYQTSSFTTSFSSVVTNDTEGTFFIWCRPEFAYTAANQTLFHLYTDTNNSHEIKWVQSGAVWQYTKKGGGTTSLNSAASSHALGEYTTIAASFGPDGMKLYINGATPTSNATATGGGSSATLYLGDQADAARPGCKFSQVAVLPFQLDDDTVRRYMATPELVRPHSVNKARSASLSANERAVLDFEKGTATHINTSLTQTNDVGNWDTNGWPLVRAPKTCFYLPSGESASSIKINYRKRYL